MEAPQAANTEVTHESNEWGTSLPTDDLSRYLSRFVGIELVSDSGEASTDNPVDAARIQFASSSGGTVSLEQVKYQYAPRAKCNSQVDTSDNETSAASTARDDELSIEDLMAQMKSM